MANEINKDDPHYKGEFGSIYEVNQKFPSGGVAGDFVVIDGWAHYWNADRASWCVNALRDSYWDELITNIIDRFKAMKGATYMGIATPGTIPDGSNAKLYYFALASGTYANFGNLTVPSGISVLITEDGKSWTVQNLIEVAQELGVSTSKVVCQKTVKDALDKKFDKANVVQVSGDSEEAVMSQKAVSDKLSDLAKNLDKTTIKDEEGNVQDTPFKVIENEEFIHAITDGEDKLLFGIYRATGKPYFPLNDMYHVEQNEEFFAVWLDAADHVLFGIRRDGEIIGEIHACNALKQVISQLQADVVSLQEKVGTIDTNLKELLDVFSLQENEEYLAVETDAEGKVLSCTNPDGSHYIHKVMSETIPTEFEHIEDPEGRMEITTDAEGKVLAERREDGERHEVKMNIDNLKVSNLNLQGNSVENIKGALRASGFDVKTPIDWSDSSFIQIPEPRFTIVNITGITAMPTSKMQNLHAWMAFWDMQGNYFKKRVILNAQGNSSMGFVKKNAAIDICNDEWIGDDTAKIRFGNWVSQDSFHLKAYYTDFFRGIGVVSYKLYEQIVKTRGNMYDKPWKKALIDMDSIGVTTKSLGNPLAGQLDLQTDTGALCHPDGFPIALYLNDEFYGIFSWQLKKHRDNYHMDKSTAEHIHLDGGLNVNSIFGGSNKIDWSQFEIRNPKGLYAIGGNKYDADIKQEEIAGETEISSWIETGNLPDGTEITSKIKKALQMTAKVKKYIQNLSDAMPSIKAAASTYENSNKSKEELDAFKSIYEKYFDVENQEDYIIASDITKNEDGFDKNWQFTTYDGKKWWVNIYDCDMTFGGHFTGAQITEVLTNHLNSDLNLPNGYIIKYYSEELRSRYKTLSNLGIIDASNILNMLKDWMMRIGTSFYEEEYKKWKDSPCINNSVIRTEYWELIIDDNGIPETDSSETFNATNSYNIGDIVSFGMNLHMGFYKFKCVKQTKSLEQNYPHSISEYSPIVEFRHNDSLYRFQKWVEKNIENMNVLYNK